MSGEQPLETLPNPNNGDLVKERIRKVDELLDNYVENLGIKYNSCLHHDDIERYLNLSIMEMNRMTSEECAQASYLLNQYAHYIQKEINRETAHLNWAKSQLGIEVAKYDGQYPGFKYEERCKHAIAADSYLYKLSQVEVWAQARIDRLSFLPARYTNMANSLDNLGRTKLRANNG